MSNDGNKPATTDEVIWSVIVLGILLLFNSLTDSCAARYRYLDLRDRLERIEQERK